jgi:hypothetical protein
VPISREDRDFVQTLERGLRFFMPSMRITSQVFLNLARTACVPGGDPRCGHPASRSASAR